MYNLEIVIDEFGLDDPLFAQVNSQLAEKFMHNAKVYLFNTLEEMGRFISAIKDYIFNGINIDCEGVNLTSKLEGESDLDNYRLIFFLDWHDFYEYDTLCLYDMRANS